MLAVRLFALPLIETETDVLAPGASVPAVAESVFQVAVLLAVQVSVAPPVLLSVYDWLSGANGPPLGPEKHAAAAFPGLTVSSGDSG